jgi:hypothetical protein
MTWIAACSGQRGIYQEVIMTDEERQKLAELHAIGNCDISIGPDTHALCKWAADEIERLAALVQSGAEPQETLNKQPPGPDSILHELGECPDASMLETAANLIEQLAHKLVATDERIVQLEARVEALERM